MLDFVITHLLYVLTAHTVLFKLNGGHHAR